MDNTVIEDLPETFQAIIEDFRLADKNERLELLLEYAKELPPLPPHMQENTAEMEQVTECQTPFFLASEVKDGKVTFYYDVPLEAPTTRGYASILAQGLNGSSPQMVLKVPNTFYNWIGLGDIISPLRLRGVEGVLNRMKRQMATYLHANPQEAK
jgi:cysteine desulfuration protein SufE